MKSNELAMQNLYLAEPQRFNSKTKTMANCKNCELALEPDYDHCPKCGQKTSLHRLTMHDLFHEALHYFTHADKGLLQLIRDLVLKTGTVAREYIDGKRKKYFSPLNFFLLVAAVFVFIFSLQSLPDLEKLIGPALSPQQIRGIRVMIFFNHYSNFVAMLALPLTAFIFYLFYKKARFNYTEHLVACMYMVGFILLVHALVILPVVKFSGMESKVGVMALSLFQVAYSAIFYYRLVNRKTTAGKVKAFFVSLASMLIWFTLSGFIVRLYITHGFWGLMV